MLKWFAVPSAPAEVPREVLTDDPLATLALSLPRLPGRRAPSSRKHHACRRPRHIYAVSRVNPIFEDDVVSRRDTPPESPGKSASSGYSSNPVTSSSEFSDDVTPSGSRRGCHRLSAEAIASQHVALSTIPEGQVPPSVPLSQPPCIPAPIWPGSELAMPGSHAATLRPKQQRIIGSVRDLWDMKVNGSRRLLVESDEDEPPVQLPQNCASSSSSSGYVTPPRRSVSPPCVVAPCPLPPVFLHSDLSQVSNSVRNAMIYGTLCRIKCAGGLSVMGASYERLIGISKTLDARLVAAKHESAATSCKCLPEVLPPAKTAGNYFPPSQRPDFTLDMPGAERLMRKIAASKRQRCWCRFSVSLLGLLFFLLSVMAVSMMYTRGRRLFGSL